MLDFKYIFIGILLLISASFALTLSSSAPVQTVAEGDAAAFELVISAQGETVELTADSELPIAISQTFIDVTGVETVNVIAYTKNFPTGGYAIEITAKAGKNIYTYPLSVIIKDQQSALKLDTVYDELDLVPGEDAELRFVLSNVGTQSLKNIVIRSDILKSFEPDYPSTIALKAGEEQEFEIELTVPSEAADNEYIFTVTAASGDIEVSQEIEIEIAEDEEIADALSLDVSDSWKPIKDSDGNVIGYEIPFTVENDETLSLDNVEVEFTGMPADWEVKGDTEFDIESLDEKDFEVKIYPANFDEITVRMKLMYDGETLDSETLQFAGYKVGAPTGMFFMGGSLTIGILLVVVIILILLYIRQRGKHTEEIEDVKTKAYLEDLVKKAQQEKSSEKKTRKGK